MKTLSNLCFLIAILFYTNLKAQIKDKPNILFIAIDDMNDWIGPLGGLSITKTPNLDSLAKNSIVFSNAHCSSPACSPSRLSVMTGVMPHKSSVLDNQWYDGPKWREIPSLKNIETIDQFFKNRGYKTLGGGKIYHSLAPPWTLINQADPNGWDFYYPNIYAPIPFQIRGKKEIIDPDYFIGRRHKYFTWGPLEIDDNKMSDYHVVDWVISELKKDHEKPLFLAFGLFRPHMPWEVPKKYFEMFPLEDIKPLETKENDLEDAYDHGRRKWHKFVEDNMQWEKVIQAYLASVAFADNQIGRVIRALKASKNSKNTIIILWSDHGMHIGEKENWEKFSLWEESTRVPLFISFPNMSSNGIQCDEPVSLVDIYPTLAELAGYDPPNHCDGESLLPQLQNIHAEKKKSAMTSFKFSSGDIGHSLRSKNFRYIFYASNNLEELYNHQTDPNEFENLAYNPGFREKIDDFRKQLSDRLELKESFDKIIKPPKGYKVYDGKIKKTGFIPISQIKNDPKPK